MENDLRCLVERTIVADVVRDAVAELCVSANRYIPAEMRGMMAEALTREESECGRSVLARLIENYQLAADTGLPVCQDTGMAVVMVELGQQVRISGDLYSAINEGVRRGYGAGLLRKSIVTHPLTRKNSGDNTPAFIHLRLTLGNQLRITLLPKGGGSENAGALQMLKPSDGAAGVVEFVVERLSVQAVNACPPLIIGVGLGSNFEGCALLAKQALLRPLGTANADAETAALEVEILTRVNRLGVGPAGYGGTITALAVHVETAPCHIACLPCAVNVQCNAHRLASVVI